MEKLNHIWSKDHQYVYCNNSKVLKADLQTFKVLNAIFAKDAHHVFYIEGIAHGIDTSTFIPLDVGKTEKTDSVYAKEFQRWRYRGYGKDKDHIYFHDMMSGKPRTVKGADSDSFEVLDFDYAKDGNHVYYYGHRVKEANSSNFEIINAFFARDNRSVFYNGNVIPKIDPENFEVIGDYDSKWSFWGKDNYYLVRRNELFAKLEPLEGI